LCFQDYILVIMLSLFSKQKSCELCEKSPAIDILCRMCEFPATRCEPCGDARWCQRLKFWVCEDCASSCPACGDFVCEFCPDSRCVKCKICKWCVDLTFYEDEVAFFCDDCGNLRRNGEKWTEKEVELLEKLMSENKKDSDMVAIFSRSKASIGSKRTWIRNAKGKSPYGRPDCYDWMPLAIMECLEDAPDRTMSIKSIRAYIRLHYGEKCADEVRDNFGRIRWERSVKEYLWRNPCFERVGDEDKKNPKYRFADMRELAEMEKECMKESKNKPRRIKSSFSKAMNFIKAFRK